MSEQVLKKEVNFDYIHFNCSGAFLSGGPQTSTEFALNETMNQY